MLLEYQRAVNLCLAPAGLLISDFVFILNPGRENPKVRPSGLSGPCLTTPLKPSGCGIHNSSEFMRPTMPIPFFSNCLVRAALVVLSLGLTSTAVGQSSPGPQPAPLPPSLPAPLD